MEVLLIFAFISGLITIFAPCIWPLLPIILSSTSTGGKKKPLGITLGIITSFAFFTLTISYIVKIIPFDPNGLRFFAVIIIAFLGLTLVIPQLTHLLEGYVSRISSKFGSANKSKGDAVPGGRQGFGSGLITGLSLGIVWTPCAGPILATIATLAATQTVNFQIILVTLVYVIGVGIPLFIFAQLGQSFFTKSRFMSKYTGRVQQIFGVIMILTALAIATNYDKTLQVKLLDAFPGYSRFILDLESQDSVEEQLDKLRNNQENKNDLEMPFPVAKNTATLPRIAVAPEFTGINNWLNVDKPLTMADLKGKVVLIDFWTYTCINCIRTLPHINDWYQKYSEKGLVIVGVHTPEFEFEKDTQNVKNAISQYGIHYPVAQDNDFKTWRAYNNRYWPAKYLIDANGVIRYTHFGEGEYDVTEENIKKLLDEAGMTVDDDITTDIVDETPRSRMTPETYLGVDRAQGFASPERLTVGTKEYTLPSTLALNSFAYEGTWTVDGEKSTTSADSAMNIHFSAGKVFLVIHPSTVTNTVKVFLDGAVINDADAGADVTAGVVTVDKPMLYELVNLELAGNHILRLEFEDVATEVYAFTFGN